MLHDEEVVLHGAAVIMCGDSLAAVTYIGGFKEGVGFSLRKCRMCMATGTEMSSKVCMNAGGMII